MADVQSWDPTAVTFPVGQSIFKCVYDSPLTYSSDQKLQPRQIASRKWVHDNSTGLEITLRDDICFHDGSKLTTEDVKYSWVTRPQKDKKLAVAGLLQDLKDVEIISPTQAVLVAVRAGTHCVMPLLARFGVPATCRASFALYNTRAEVDALAQALIKARDLFS